MNTQKKEDDIIYEVIEEEQKDELKEDSSLEEDAEQTHDLDDHEDSSLKNESEDEDHDDEHDNAQPQANQKKELTPEQRAKRNKKRAQERKRIRAQRLAEDKAKIAQLEIRTRELEELLSRQDELSRNLLAQEAEKQIQDAEYKLLEAERIMENAVKQQNGETFIQAQRYKEMVLKEKLDAEYRKQQAKIKPEQPDRVSPVLISKAIQFANEFTWFNVNGNDPDSEIVKKIDQRLTREGYDPESDLYWDELRERVKSRFPNKISKNFDDDEDEDEMEEIKPQKRVPVGGPPTSSTRDSSSRTEYVHITPETKKWLQEWGVYDDPVQREKFIREIAKQKKQQRN